MSEKMYVRVASKHKEPHVKLYGPFEDREAAQFAALYASDPEKLHYGQAAWHIQSMVEIYSDDEIDGLSADPRGNFYRSFRVLPAKKAPRHPNWTIDRSYDQTYYTYLMTGRHS